MNHLKQKSTLFAPSHAVFLWAILLIVVALGACTPTQNALYFNNAATNGMVSNNINPDEPIIQKNDLLSISVSSLNAEATAIFNAPNTQATSTSTSTGNTSAGGYLVNFDGNVQMPILGNIKAEGLTKKQLKSAITQLINDKKLLVDPIVTIRHLNFEVTIIGEVGKPTVINVPSEKISLLKALGIAGDITIYGKKHNVLLIREEEGKRTINRINLNDGQFLSSPYYYLKPNDVIYVEANERKIKNATRNTQLVPTVLSALSIIAIVVTNLIRN
jgi:polysaccharide export outer membrane protein